MTVRCVALSSGGLDSMLAIRSMQEQGIEVEALNIKTLFSCCQDDAGRTSRLLGVNVTVIATENDYLDVLRHPDFGYGRGANPCVDCRIYMFRKAKAFMEQVDARFVVSGEVVGQRPMSQKRNDLEVIAHHSGLGDSLLRPLSALVLPATLPERTGWVDRNGLFGFVGRSRKGLIRLAKRYGLAEIPTPSVGCALTESGFSRKVWDLIRTRTDCNRWDFELLKVGRHFRFDGQTKVVVGRRETENDSLEYLFGLPEATGTTLVMPDNFNGPAAMVVGRSSEEATRFAAALILRYARRYDPQNALVEVRQGEREQTLHAEPREDAANARTLADG